MWVAAALAAYQAYNGQGGGGGGGGGGPQQNGTSDAVAGAYGSGLDSSGMVVNFSGTTSANYRRTDQPTVPSASAPALSFLQPAATFEDIAPAQAGGMVTWVMVGLLVLVAWRSKRSR